MPRDYKHSIQRNTKPEKPFAMDGWDRVLIVVFVLIASLWIKSVITTQPNSKTLKPLHAGFVSQSSSDELDDEVITKDDDLLIPFTDSEEYNQQQQKDPDAYFEQLSSIVVPVEPEKPAKQDKKLEEPHFDFYTILPSVEVVIPEYEIKTRVREEKIAANSPTEGIKKPDAEYIMQAGSFRNYNDAMLLQSRLQALGFNSRLERAQVGEVIWTRVKVGPYLGMTSIMDIKTQLKANGIDVLVLEFNG